MKALEVARRRMRNSRLTGPSFDSPDEVVRWHGAMQTQDYGPAKWSIGLRTANLVDDDVEQAMTDGAILRTHVLRPTWHFVVPDDIRWLLALTGHRVHQHNGRRYRELGLDEKTLARCQRLIVSALEGGNHLTRDGIARVLDSGKVDRGGQRLPYILMHCELEAVICSGPRAGKQQTYALLDERAPKARRVERDQALVELTRRYLASHGPATVQDLRWWSSLTVADIKRALEMLGSDVESETIDDLTFWFVEGDSGGVPRGGGVHLLQAYDELIVGYTESRFLGDARASTVSASRLERSLPTGIIMLDGAIAGHWRRTMTTRAVRLELLMYDQPARKEIHALDAAGADFGKFLQRPVTVELRTL